MYMEKDNALLELSTLPQFSKLKQDTFCLVMDSLLSSAREQIGRALENNSDDIWGDIIDPVQQVINRVHRAWGQISHINGVVNSSVVREAYNVLAPKVTSFFAEISQNAELFESLKDLRNSESFDTLNLEQRKFVDNQIRDFRLGGAELSDENQDRLRVVSENLSKLSSSFNDNVLDATDKYFLQILDNERLDGIPPGVVNAAKSAAQARGLPGWCFTLHAPSWIPFMQSCKDRPLREQMYRAFVTRASEFGDDLLDNTENMKEILANRSEKARLLGFNNFADLSLETKMVIDDQEVRNFLNSMIAAAKPIAQQEVRVVSEFAKSELNIDSLEPWDLSFAIDRLKERSFSFSDEEVRRYLPLSKVKQGLFRLVHDLYNVDIQKLSGDVWHSDVEIYQVSNDRDEVVGYFYVDLFSRPGKRPGAWMDDAISRWRGGSHDQLPVAYLVCNFPEPGVGENDSFLSHDEVQTFFHEMGHVLHHVLTKVDVMGVSGINGVEWDAVELPSQFMENFCWDWGVIQKISCDPVTGDSMPRSLFDKLLKAKNFMSGIQTLRQLEFSLFDFEIHSKCDDSLDVQRTLADVRRQTSVIAAPEYNRFAHSFSHIFGGGYAAGYYSYKWAEVLSADAFEAFQEEPEKIPELGKRFLREILSMGGARSALENFIAFRKRPPKIDALLRQSGLAGIQAVR